MSKLSFSALLAALRRDSGPPLFYLLERPFAALAESLPGDAFLRLLPFLATLILFAGAFRLSIESGRRWLLALLASSPFLLVYAAEARAYGLLALVSLALFLLLFRGEQRPARLAAAAILTAAALWIHYLSLFLVAACIPLLLLRRRFGSAAAALAGAVLFVPWIPKLAVQPLEATSWMGEPIGRALVALLEALGGAGRIPIPLGGPLPSGLAAAGGLIGLGLLIGVAIAARRDRETADASAVVAVTMGLVLAASLFRPVAFPGRSEMVILPVWLWAVARTAASDRRVRWLAAASAVVGTAACLFLWAAPMPEPIASRAVSVVARLARPGDRVIAAAGFYLPARLASDRGRLAAPLTSFPADLAGHPGWITLKEPTESDYRTLEASLATLPAGSRAYFLLHPILRTPRLDRLLTERGAVRALVQRSDATILVCIVR